MERICFAKKSISSLYKQVQKTDSKVELFYRAQNTKDIEKNSFYIDLELMYEAIKMNMDEIEDIYQNNLETLKLRSSNPKELFERILKCKSFQEVVVLEKEYKIKGIFGWNKEYVDNEYSLNDVLSGENSIEYIDGRKYWVLYEGRTLLDEEDNGIIFEPSRIVGLWEFENV